MKRAINLGLLLLLLFCLLGSLSLLHLGDSIMQQVPVPTQDDIMFGGPVPPGGTCADVGKDYDAPFFGWPVEYRQKDWNTISAWFCDPNYRNRNHKWVMHSGIDIATYWCSNKKECISVNISGSNVVVTTTRAMVLEVKRDCPPVWYGDDSSVAHKCGWPMGNHVILEAELEEKDCDPRNPKHCIIYWVLSGWTATYMHLNEVEDLPIGQELVKGDKIGEVGNTGNSSGAHSHYQINMPPGGKGKAVDPAPTLAKNYSDVLRTLGSHNRPYGP